MWPEEKGITFSKPLAHLLPPGHELGAEKKCGPSVVRDEINGGVK